MNIQAYVSHSLFVYILVIGGIVALIFLYFRTRAK